jgi:hypothetical protein
MIPGFGPEIITTSEIPGCPTRHAKAVRQRSDLMKFGLLINRYSRIDAKVKRDHDPVLLLLKLLIFTYTKLT